MQLPLVSIVILTYKRQTALLQAIETALQQDYANFEVLVVDNHSEDDTAALVQQKFPNVKCLSLLENLGAAGRNAGFEAARGEFIVTLDNDVYFETMQELKKIVALFQERPNVACMTFRILHPESGALSVRDWFHPRSHIEYDRTEFPTYYIAEGASAFRKKVLDKTGGYDEQLFLGHEGFDLAMRIFEAGFDIHYTPAIHVRHHASLETRTSWRPYFYNTRNYFIIGWKYFRFGLSLRFLLPRIAMLALFALRTGKLAYYFKGIAAGIKECRNLKSPRTPMSKKTERKILELSTLRPGLRFWFRKHSKKPLL